MPQRYWDACGWDKNNPTLNYYMYIQGIYVKYLFLGTAGKTNRNGATRLQRMQLWMSLPGIYWCLLAFFPVSLLHWIFQFNIFILMPVLLWGGATNKNVSNNIIANIAYLFLCVFLSLTEKNSLVVLFSSYAVAADWFVYILLLSYHYIITVVVVVAVRGCTEIALAVI